ncbi:hypothetical protein N7505_007262 [Penicillium chrysogenum]|uniref:Uncharacterized protein n=1 Tax=Penicillium chrysogenum TaxID=5076 RepID=A0ABQ8WD32_PENCH|nr:hypothetical protein N7505_007262 [Penicillium chrysogenum]
MQEATMQEATMQEAHDAGGPRCGRPTMREAHDAGGPRCGRPTMREIRNGERSQCRTHAVGNERWGIVISGFGDTIMID